MYLQRFQFFGSAFFILVRKAACVQLISGIFHHIKIISNSQNHVATFFTIQKLVFKDAATQKETKS
jgi:hypothetical protein